MLDSTPPGSQQGRYSFMGSRPFLVFTARGRQWSVLRDRRVERGRGEPFQALGRLLAHWTFDAPAGAPPFLAGAVGFAGYEAGRMLERLHPSRVPSTGVPDICFAFYDSVLALDTLRGEAWLAGTGLRGPWASSSGAQAARAREIAVRLATAPPDRPLRQFRMTSPLHTSLPREKYIPAVAEIKEAIRQGEIYQANLTRRYSAAWSGDPVALYLGLREVSPAPFSAFLDFGRVKVVSSSPERYLRVRGRRIETRPIKGTRPRQGDPAADRKMALELLQSQKDSAEHVMIVDLERNDLGRVCQAGTVKVAELAALEVYPQVFHLTSTVTGRLRDGVTAMDALRASFPGGSITGAPKIRSMELLARLEPEPRDIYTGALGWFSFNGDCDLSIAIRVVTLAGRRLSFSVGGGIVADSDPAQEYEETLHKARGILDALGVARPGDAPVAAPKPAANPVER